MSKILVARITGGLGNQLFCYATAKRLAIVNGAELVLDNTSGFKYDYKFRRKYILNNFNISSRIAFNNEKFEPFGRIRRFINRKYCDFQKFQNKRYIRQIGIDFDSKILSLRLKEGLTYFEPFGQSEDYFKDIRYLLKKELIIKSDINNENIEFSKLIKDKNSVCVHIRWFNNYNIKDPSNIPSEYYLESIERALKKIDNPHFFIFSNDISLSKKILINHICNLNFTFVKHNSKDDSGIFDFWLMNQCKHFIIGNSTFAWWAAWIGELNHHNSLIFSPKNNIYSKKNITAWGFYKLIPDRWILI